MEFVTEKTCSSGNMLWLLVLAIAAGGFGYSFGYSNGHGRAIRQADERLDHVWQFLPAEGNRDGGAGDEAEDLLDPLRAVGPAAPAPHAVGVADSIGHGGAGS